MLDIMRRRKGAIRVILGLVVVSVAGSFALALYGVWGGALSGNVQGAPNWIASVDGKQIPVQLFQRHRGMILQDIRERLGGQNAKEETLSQIADQQALGQLLGTYLAQQQAESSGLHVSEAEISSAIVGSPGFQRNGRFVGATQYRMQLSALGLTPAAFEQEVASELAADKLRMAIYALARVDDSQVEKRYHDETERVDVSYVLLADTAYADPKPPTEAEARAYFSAHASSYMTPETRRAAYVLFDRESKASGITIAPEALKEYYEKNKSALYSHKEQRRASHILVKLPPNATPDQDAAARDKAAKALARVRGGEDFAAVAREMSDDPGSASAGGDLGFFERGRMVKEFEDPAFTLSVGSISDVIKSAFGYHVIKVTESRPAGTQPFEEVQGEIKRTLALQKAQEEIRKAADDFVSKLSAQESSFDKVAAAAGMTVEDTGFFAKGEAAGKIGRLPQADEAVFTLKPGDHSTPVAVPQGLAIFSLAGTRAPQPAPFESVRAKVEADLKTSHARDKARAVAAEIMAASGALAQRVEKRKLEVKTYPQVSRVQPLPPLTDVSKEAAFKAPVGSVIGPFQSDDGLVVLEVTGKTPASPEEAAKAREDLKRRVLDDERLALYQAFLARLQKNSKIDVNESLLQQGRFRG